MISNVQGSYLPIRVDNNINPVINCPFVFIFRIIKLLNGGEYLHVSLRKVSAKSMPYIQVIGQFVFLVKIEKLKKGKVVVVLVRSRLWNNEYAKLRGKILSSWILSWKNLIEEVTLLTTFSSVSQGQVMFCCYLKFLETEHIFLAVYEKGDPARGYLFPFWMVLGVKLSFKVCQFFWLPA